MLKNQIYIYKKQKIKQAKIIKKVFFIIFILFLIAGTTMFSSTLSVKDSSSTIFLILFLIFSVSLFLMYMVLNNMLKSTIKLIEIMPEKINCVFMDGVEFIIDKSNIHSIVVEEQQAGNYKNCKYYILIKHFSVNNQLCAIWRYMALKDNNNLSFSLYDIEDSNMDVKYVNEYLKKNYNELFLSKKM